MKMSRLVGTPSEPADPASIPAAAETLVAARHGVVGLRDAVDRPRGALGRRPADAVVTDERRPTGRTSSTSPASWRPAERRRSSSFTAHLETDGAAAGWWRELAHHADIVYESYFDAPRIYALGPAARQPRAARCDATADPPPRGDSASTARAPRADPRLPLEARDERPRGSPAAGRLAPVREAQRSRRTAGRDRGGRRLDLVVGLGHVRRGSGPTRTSPLPRASTCGRATRASATRRRARPFDTSLTDGQLLLPEGVQLRLPGRDGVPRRPCGGSRAVCRRRPGGVDRARDQRRALRRAVPVRSRTTQRAERTLVESRHRGSSSPLPTRALEARADTVRRPCALADRICACAALGHRPRRGEARGRGRVRALRPRRASRARSGRSRRTASRRSRRSRGRSCGRAGPPGRTGAAAGRARTSDSPRPSCRTSMIDYARVQADQVGEGERAHGMRETELRDRVDRLGLGDALQQRVRGLVDERHQDAIGDEAREVARLGGRLAEVVARARRSPRAVSSEVCRPRITSTSFSTGTGLKKCMPITCSGLAGHRGERRDRNRGGVRGENRLRRAERLVRAPEQRPP